MKRQTKQIIFFLILQLGVLFSLKYISDYVRAQSDLDFKAIKQQYFISTTDNNGQDVRYMHVKGLSKKQQDRSEVALMDYAELEDASEHRDQVRDHDHEKGSDKNGGENGELLHGISTNSDILLGEIPDPKTNEKMTEALKAESQGILTRFVDKEGKQPSHKISLDCQTNPQVASRDSQVSSDEVLENPDWRVAKYSLNQITDETNYNIEEISIKFAPEGGTINGIYKKSYSSTADFDVQISYRNFFLVQGLFEGGNGGLFSGELKKINPDTGDLDEQEKPIPFYGKACASGSAFMITTINQELLRFYPLSYQAF